MNNFNKPPSKSNKKTSIGTINPNSAEIRKETPEQHTERVRLEKENGVKANIYKDRTKYDRKDKHKGKKWE